MNLIQHHRFGAIDAYQFGFGPLGPPLMSVYLYFLDGLLIDTALSNMARQVLEIVKGLRPRKILLTHHHEDHSGNAAALKTACGAVVIGHPLTAAKMKKTNRILPYQHLVWGKARGLAVTPCDGPVETEHFVFTPIHTPGHSRDHTVYLEKENGWLFSGDLYLGEKIKFFRSDERVGDQIASLKKVLTYDFDALLCGHNPVLSGGRQRLEGKLEYLQEFLETVRRLEKLGHSPEQIIRRLDNGDDRKIKWVTLGNASFANMVRSALRAA